MLKVGTVCGTFSPPPTVTQSVCICVQYFLKNLIGSTGCRKKLHTLGKVTLFSKMPSKIFDISFIFYIYTTGLDTLIFYFYFPHILE